MCTSEAEDKLPVLEGDWVNEISDSSNDQIVIELEPCAIRSRFVYMPSCLNGPIRPRKRPTPSDWFLDAASHIIDM
jgi:hypothetical protein